MNALLSTQAERQRGTFYNRIVVLFCLLMCGGLVCAADPVSPAVPAHDSTIRTSVAARDSIAKAASDALEVAAAQRKDLMNTILEVIGSVLAIAIILFFTWKMSSRSSKPEAPRAPQRSSHSHESHQEVMQRRMKMAKK